MTPFDDYAVLDALRIVVFVWGFLLVGMQLRLWPLLVTAGQRLYVTATALALFILAGSRITHLGVPPTWELPAAVVVFTLVTAATVGRFRVGRARG